MIRRSAPLAATLLAARLSAQDAGLAGFDEETGLWFPPDASREVYIQGTDPERGYVQDVKKAFDADDALRASACELMISPRYEASLRQVGPRIAQLRTMVQMLCVALPVNRKQQDDQARVDAENTAMWRAALDLEGARALPPEERERRALELCFSCAPDAETRMKNALSALGLRPFDDAVVAAVLGAHPFPGSAPYTRYLRFLRELFADQTRDGMPEAAHWRMGLRSLHFLLGELTEARELTRWVLAHPFLPGHTYDAIFLAVLERSLGDPRAFPALLADCPVPPQRLEEREGEPRTAWCWEVARSLATRGVRQLKERSPAALADILAESIAAEPTAWDERVESIRALALADRPRARRECEALLAIPATIAPLETRLDTVAQLAMLAKLEGDTRLGLAAWDRYLDLLGFQPPPAPPDLWTRLAAIPEATGSGGAGPVRAERALGEKVALALEARDVPLARRLLETYAVLALTYPSRAEVVRYHLLQLARAELKAGRRAEAARIVGFLYSQPHEDEQGGKVVTMLSSAKAELARGGPPELKAESSPWDPTIAPRPARRRR